MPIALIVDDDRSAREAMSEIVRGKGFDPRTASTLAEARRIAEKDAIDIVLLDQQLPDGNGIELIQALDERPFVEVVMITGHGDIDSAVEALRGGAVDYLTKPVDPKRLESVLAKIVRTVELRNEIQDLRGELRQLGRFGRIVGVSPKMQKIYDMISRVAPTESTVFVTGETGTGKELVARMTHDLSRRAKQSFVPVNCGAVPGGLVESELFGHEKGSFTGADRRRDGIFARADGGTLFLDEVTEMPVDLQVKLLRVLETSSVRPVGGAEEKQVDVRVIVASNRNPEKAVAEGTLREDLLYRLNVFPIHVPPLRERPQDVELLANHFLQELNRSADTSKRFTDEAMERLRLHDWPGNVRELRNVVERAHIMGGERIRSEDVPLPDAPLAKADDGLRLPLGSSLAEAERRLILATLDHLDGNKKRTAEVLGISLKTLYNRLREYEAPAGKGSS